MTFNVLAFENNRFNLTYKLFKCDEFWHNVFGITEILARSMRRISSDEHPSSDGSSLKLLASDKTLDIHPVGLGNVVYIH